MSHRASYKAPVLGVGGEALDLWMPLAVNNGQWPANGPLGQRGPRNLTSLVQHRQTDA